MKRLARLRTYARLGPASIARVAAYRLGLKTGLHPAQRLTAPVAKPPFFGVPDPQPDLPEANAAWDEALWWFGWHSEPLPDDPPDWFANPFSNAPPTDAVRDWWRIPDFGTGDIKGVWELSRLNWVVAWATKAAKGDARALARLNRWLADWAERNPPFKGPNWKCGQETSIRAIHLVTAAWVLGQDREPEQGLVDLLATHLSRIAPTMSYAIGQQNNHGTSEAAALFMGGTFLEGHHPRAEAWARRGRHRLEERAATLIARDGSFSQYSVTYHRLMLDTYALAEAWRRHRDLPGFSDRLKVRLAAATDWLRAMVDAETGDAPNIGANDGAQLVQLLDCGYRDFRPSVQLAAALFLGADAYGEGRWTVPLRWLGIPDGKPAAPVRSISHHDGGFHVLHLGQAMAVLRYPRFRFRPSQSDALHVDLWYRGVNLLRDAGTFSYNSEFTDWFAGSAAHNTIEFDGRDQMPRLGRFLFGDWLDADAVEQVHQDEETVLAAAAYTDARGARHHRAITLMPDGLTCCDTISGSFSAACLRWRLAPGDWQVRGHELASENGSVSIEIDGEPIVPALESTMESRFYQHRERVPLALVRLNRPATIVSKVMF